MAAKLGPEQPLPHAEEFTSTEEYVNSLLDFVGTHTLLRTLCGGVHILDFFTTEPTLYDQVLPQDWRDFFKQQDDIFEVVNLLMRDDLTQFKAQKTPESTIPVPPQSLVDYIRLVRKHFLLREPGGSQCSRNRAIKPTQKLTRNVTVGMNIKKIHEVGLFASYVNQLTADISDSTGESITHLVDFGSGQNYLGRALASQPYNQNIVAIESKHANAERAREFDVLAKLVEKQKLMRDKKAFRAGLEGPETDAVSKPVIAVELPTPPPEHNSGHIPRAPEVELPAAGTGKIQYVDHRIENGILGDVIDHIPDDSAKKNLMIMSLHSCGNLVHHGLRSLVLNPEVKALAMVGCCYNLLTERLGPATYKLPELRPARDHPRLTKLGEARDAHGFPMSDRFCQYYDESNAGSDKGVRLNITSRMMAVQAPGNWGPVDSESFFTRHFYRALLQRIFLDRGVVGSPTPECVGDRSPAGHSSGGTPIVIGSLRKGCYENFASYVRGALAKLVNDPERGDIFTEKMGGISDEEIQRYEREYAEGKRNLSVMWSLMAFSAGVIEAAIVVDRYLWLKEQDQVKDAWVEPVFDYKFSPRNLVVVGVKK